MSNAKLEKGSPEAKAFMEKVRAGRNKTEGTTSSSDTVFIKPQNKGLLEREEILKEQLQEGMLTKAEMNKTPPDGVHRQLKWVKKNSKKIVEWKKIRRKLYPDDHNAANLENIRRD